MFNRGIDGNQSAFPCGVNESWGLTKREYFTVMILQGMISDNSGCLFDEGITEAIKTADELIKQLQIEDEQ